MLSLTALGLFSVIALSKWHDSKTKSFQKHTLAQIEQIMDEDAPAAGDIDIVKIMNEDSLDINDSKLVDLDKGSYYGLLKKD